MNGVINEQGERLQQVEARLQQVEATLRLAGGCRLDVPLMIDGFNTIMEGMNKLQRAQGGVEGAGVEALKGNVGNLIDCQHDRPSATSEKGKGKGKGQGKGKGKEREKRPREDDDEEEDVADAGYVLLPNLTYHCHIRYSSLVRRQQNSGRSQSEEI